MRMKWIRLWKHLVKRRLRNKRLGWSFVIMFMGVYTCAKREITVLGVSCALSHAGAILGSNAYEIYCGNIYYHIERLNLVS